MKKSVYYWQPELSVAILYWCFTFGILFISLILSLENNQPYLISNIILGFFFIFAFLGVNRYFKIQGNKLLIHTFLPMKRKTILLRSIYQINVGPKSIELHSDELTTSQLFMMTAKGKKRFIDAIKEHKETDCTIIKDPDLKTDNHS